MRNHSLEDLKQSAEDILDLLWHMGQYPDTTDKYANAEQAAIALVEELKAIK